MTDTRTDRESVEQARKALHKIMHEKVSNFDRGAVCHWAERGQYVMKADYDVLLAERDALQADVLTWRKVAQRMTPGGSEYFDPKAVEAHIDDFRERFHKAMTEKVLLGRKVDALQAKMEEAYQYALHFADAFTKKHFPENTGWKPFDDLLGLLTQIDNMTTVLQAKLDEAADMTERLKTEAMVQAQEARTQRSIVHECLQAATGATGEPGDWHGAEPVKARIAELEAELREARMQAISDGCELQEAMEAQTGRVEVNKDSQSNHGDIQ